MTDLSHFVEVSGNAATCLGIRVERVGFGAKKAEETKYVLNVH